MAGVQELRFNARMGLAKLLPLQSRLETAEMQLADVTAALERLQSEHKRLQVGSCLPACALQEAAGCCLVYCSNVQGRGSLCKTHRRLQQLLYNIPLSTAVARQIADRPTAAVRRQGMSGQAPCAGCCSLAVCFFGLISLAETSWRCTALSICSESHTCLLSPRLATKSSRRWPA